MHGRSSGSSPGSQITFFFKIKDSLSLLVILTKEIVLDISEEQTQHDVPEINILNYFLSGTYFFLVSWSCIFICHWLPLYRGGINDSDSERMRIQTATGSGEGNFTAESDSP